MLYNRRGVSDYALYDEAGIVERTGVRPDKYPMLAALRGDPSDNLLGVPGVGEKTAAKLLNTYGDIDGIFANLDALTPKLRANLAEPRGPGAGQPRGHPARARRAPRASPWTQLTLGGWDLDTARECFTELELKSTWDRVVPLLQDGTLGPPAPGSGDPVVRGRRCPTRLGGRPRRWRSTEIGVAARAARPRSPPPEPRPTPTTAEAAAGCSRQLVDGGHRPLAVAGRCGRPAGPVAPARGRRAGRRARRRAAVVRATLLARAAGRARH